jgi:hypothetical protein
VELTLKHAGDEVDPLLRAAFHTVQMCCVTEAVASVFLERNLADTESPSAGVAVGDLLADEVLHARAGWTYLASRSPRVRSLVEEHQLSVIQPAVLLVGAGERDAGRGCAGPRHPVNDHRASVQRWRPCETWFYRASSLSGST